MSRAWIILIGGIYKDDDLHRLILCTNLFEKTGCTSDSNMFVFKYVTKSYYKYISIT